MTALRDEAELRSRLRRAVLAFQEAQRGLLRAHRRLKDLSLPQAEVDAYWAGPGARAEAHLRLTAQEVVAAFQAFSAAGLVAEVSDRHQVTEAQRYLAEHA